MTPVHLVRVAGVPLVFGLSWVPVLGDSARAQRLARREGARHQILSGNPPAALGLATRLPVTEPCWSAADLLARLHPQGSWACVLPLGAQHWHLLGCHEGVALARADRRYPTESLALQALDALRGAYPKLQIPPAASQTEALLQKLALAATGAPPLGRVPACRSKWLVSVAGLLLLTILGGQYWATSRATPVPRADARHAWQAALQRAMAARPVHGKQGTRHLLAAVQAQPVRVAGWVLETMRCQLGSQHWQCASDYRRVAPQANNQGLMQEAPTGWRLDFPSLDTARAQWSPMVSSQVPAPQDLPAAQLLARRWASSLQAVLPAFTSVQLKPPQPLVLLAPRDVQGQLIPQPADLPVVRVRPLSVRGPLRSADLLAPLAQAVSWQKLVLSHAPGVRPSLKNSRLILHLEGAVYEIRH